MFYFLPCTITYCYTANDCTLSIMNNLCWFPYQFRGSGARAQPSWFLCFRISPGSFQVGARAVVSSEAHLRKSVSRLPRSWAEFISLQLWDMGRLQSHATWVLTSLQLARVEDCTMMASQE